MSEQRYKCLGIDSKKIDYDEQGEYEQECPVCGTTNTLWTQRDECPEYYTDVTTLCRCGKRIKWKLPVN